MANAQSLYWWFLPKYPNFNKHSPLSNIFFLFSFFLKINQFCRPFCWILIKLGSNLPEWLLLGKKILICSEYWFEVNEVTKIWKIVWNLHKKRRKKSKVFVLSLRVQQLAWYWRELLYLRYMQKLLSIWTIPFHWRLGDSGNLFLENFSKTFPELLVTRFDLMIYQIDNSKAVTYLKNI